MTSTATTPLRTQQLGSGRKTLLIVPPFQALQTPSLGVSQLKANLLAKGFDAEVLYLNFWFADRIGANLYEGLAATGPYLVGDFIFSRVAHDRTEGDVERYVQDVILGSDMEEQFAERFPNETPVQALERLIGEARGFVAGEAMREILDRDPWMVGFSSTFQANCSSLAVIREIKRRKPELLTLIGGANCEVEMGEELLACYPEIDFVGRGECDKTIVQFVRSLAAGESGKGIDGFLARGDDVLRCPSKPLHSEDLDAQPYPDFQDYFEQLQQVGICDRIEPGLAMETSRGCWWGQKSHCTFCAFNRDGMIFRSKAPDRALEELQSQVQRYDLPRMEMTDNILDMGYFKTLLPQLQEQPVAELFWETKANLTREQIQMMERAKIRWIQPGIESLSDKTLKLMRKGSTQLQNVLLLKTCAESGVLVSWNWLFGFPGESHEELPDLARAARSVQHLQPPSSSPVLYVERFAPYQATPEEWNLGPVVPAKAYKHVYPFPQKSLDRIAFFFDCRDFDDVEGSDAHKQLKAIVADWQKNYRNSHFLAIPRKSSLVLVDTRQCRTKRLHRLKGLERRIYEYCWQIRGENQTVKQFAAEASAEQVSAILQKFVKSYLMLSSGGRFLSLATDPRLGYKRFTRVFPGGSIKAASQPTESRARRLLDVAMFRTPPAAALRGVARTLRGMKVRWTNRAVIGVCALLGQKGPELQLDGRVAENRDTAPHPQAKSA